MAARDGMWDKEGWRKGMTYCLIYLDGRNTSFLISLGYLPSLLLVATSWLGDAFPSVLRPAQWYDLTSRYRWALLLHPAELVRSSKSALPRGGVAGMKGCIIPIPSDLLNTIAFPECDRQCWCSLGHKKRLKAELAYSGWQYHTPYRFK